MNGYTMMPIGRYAGRERMKDLKGYYLLYVRRKLNGKTKMNKVEVEVWNYINDNFDEILAKKYREKDTRPRKKMKYDEI